MSGTTEVTPGTELTVQTEQAPADEAMMSMLHEHVPLSLLCDLTAPEGPESAEILAEEGVPDDKWWEQ
jgi:hypothetical protein